MTGTGRSARRATSTPLLVLAVILGISGLLRLGEAGAAMAVEARLPPEGDAPDLAAALTAIRDRQAELDAREAALADRMQALAVAEASVERRMAELLAAEDRLSGLVQQAEEAAEADLLQLTAVYENMKPKEASLLFERMSPDFAAGFLGRMRPDAAAAILAGLPPEQGYSISVLLAGRNADAAAFASGE